jgi:DNA repair protein RadC
MNLENPHLGHRERLLIRFAQNGISSLADYEILELLLSYAIPRKDTKPIAKELISHFKSINAVLNAELSELKNIKGLGTRSCMLFHLIRDIISYCLKERYKNQPLIKHRKDVEEYLKFYFGHRTQEYVAAIFLNAGQHIISTQIITEGTVTQCAIYPRSIIEKAILCKAASIIIAHNHPGGSSTPSDADWNITERLAKIGKLLEIPLLDHIIVTRDRVVSLRDFPRWPCN